MCKHQSCQQVLGLQSLHDRFASVANGVSAQGRDHAPDVDKLGCFVTDSLVA